MLGQWIAGAGRRYYDAAWRAVTQADAQARFRVDPDYTTILEHVPDWQGRQCLDLIEDADIRALLAASQPADQLGGAAVHDFDGMILSPTTVRYGKVLQDLCRFFPGFPRFASIAEIGIGYGGQARLISDYAAEKTMPLRRYDLVDMLPVTLLAQSYLDNFNLHFGCRFLTKSQIAPGERWDFVMSNYAFSEFDAPLQEEYLAKIVGRASSGYLTMNTGLDPINHWGRTSLSVERLVEALPNACLMPETPSTGPKNYVLVFGDHSCGAGVGIEDLRRLA